MYKEYLKQLGDSIKLLRKNNNYSQLELAKLINSSQASVNKWEHGISDPSSFYILALSKVFKISTDDLINNNFIMQQNNIDITKTFHKVDIHETNETINITIKK